MNHVGERPRGCAELHGEDELSHDFARTRSDQGRANQHSARAVAYELERAP